MTSLDLKPTVLSGAIAAEDLARAMFGEETPAGGIAPRRVLGAMLRRFLVPPHQRVIKLMYQAGEPLPEAIEYLVDTALRQVCDLLGIDEQPAGARDRLRLRFMRGAEGKQFHRNLYDTANAIALLEGEQRWHFLPTTPEIDAVFGAFDDDAKYCGFRSGELGTALPNPPLLDRLATMLAEAGQDTQVQTFVIKAGDVLVFDGRWWHATRHLTSEVTHLQIALNGDEVNERPQKRGTRELFRPRGKYTALLWPAKDTAV